MNKTVIKAIFYLLIAGTAFAAALLYFKSASVGGGPATTGGNGSAPATACIITIDGKKYDVQPLRNTHTGGDIFQCGTDMSATFHRQHNDNLQMIQKYLVK